MSRVHDDVRQWLAAVADVPLDPHTAVTRQWLHALISENERLTTLVDVARGIVVSAHGPRMATNWATDRLQVALADFEREATE